jgi:hypothetical protein
MDTKVGHCLLKCLGAVPQIQILELNFNAFLNFRLHLVKGLENLTNLTLVAAFDQLDGLFTENVSDHAVGFDLGIPDPTLDGLCQIFDHQLQ